MLWCGYSFGYDLVGGWRPLVVALVVGCFCGLLVVSCCVGLGLMIGCSFVVG